MTFKLQDLLLLFLCFLKNQTTPQNLLEPPACQEVEIMQQVCHVRDSYISCQSWTLCTGHSLQVCRVRDSYISPANHGHFVLVIHCKFAMLETVISPANHGCFVLVILCKYCCNPGLGITNAQCRVFHVVKGPYFGQKSTGRNAKMIGRTK